MRVITTSTEVKADISVVQLSTTEEHTRMLREVVNFLKELEAKELELERFERLANKLDKIFFWFYLVSITIYFIAMIYVMIKYKCQVNHFDFWY